MGKKLAVHLQAPPARGLERPFYIKSEDWDSFSACGFIRKNISPNLLDVTCVHCIRLARKNEGKEAVMKEYKEVIWE